MTYTEDERDVLKRDNERLISLMESLERRREVSFNRLQEYKEEYKKLYSEYLKLSKEKVYEQ